MKRVDRISSLFLLGICTFFYLRSERFSPLSALFPRVIIIILGALALVLLISTFFKKGEQKSFDTEAFRHTPSMISLGLIILWIAAIPLTGFLTASVIFFPVISVFLDRKVSRKKKTGRVVIAVTISVAFYLFFTKVLYVPFPEGLLL